MYRLAPLTLLLLVAHAALASAQAAVEMTPIMKEIPRSVAPGRDYRSWTLFLVCENWATPAMSGDLAALYRMFRPFGDKIGDDNLAVWFWQRPTPVDNPRLSENIDVARSVRYCQALKLPPSDGPFLVVTTAYPDLNAFPAERAVFTLGGLQPSAVIDLLRRLGDQLLLEAKMDAIRAASLPAAPGQPPAAPSLWIRLLEGARQTIIGLGCQVKMQITTGVLTAELRGCAA